MPFVFFAQLVGVVMLEHPVLIGYVLVTMIVCLGHIYGVVWLVRAYVNMNAEERKHVPVYFAAIYKTLYGARSDSTPTYMSGHLSTRHVE